MGTLNERSAKAQIIWNSTASNSINPTMVGSLFYDINIQKLERDNSNAVYETADETYTKVAAINPTTKKWALIDVPTGGGGGSIEWGTLSSFDESILIEPDGNIEVNVSLFTEYFNQQVCELNFSPIQIIGVYKNGIKLLPEEFNITLPKTITIKTYSTEKIEIQYTHLKNN